MPSKVVRGIPRQSDYSLLNQTTSHMKARNIINTIALTVLLLAGSAAAQTTSPTTTPGTPNTGSGGTALANVLMLTASAAVALGGVALPSRRKTL
jgi:hypothetical protein